MTTATAFEIRTLTPHPTLEYWSVCKIEALFETPFLDLVYRAAQVHRENFNPKAIQLSTLMSIKTGDVQRIVVTVRSQHVIILE